MIFRLCEILLFAVNHRLLVCLNISIHLCLSRTLVPPSKAFHRVFFVCRNSILGDAEVYFLHFPLYYSQILDFFALNFILVQVINSFNLLSTLFASRASFVRTVISMNVFSCGFITVIFTYVDFDVMSSANTNSATKIVISSSDSHF